MLPNIWQLKEVGDFEAQNCLPIRNEVKAGLPPQNLLRSTIPIAIGIILPLTANFL